MTLWKTAALSVALLGAAAAGAAVAPASYAQTESRAVTTVTPRAVEVFTTGSSRIGVSVEDVNAADPKAAAGVSIDSVEEGSPAATAGLQKGDIVVEFDGERVRSVRQFARLVSETPAGRQVPVTLMRDGRRESLTIAPRESTPFRALEDGWRAFEELRNYSRKRPGVPAPPAPPGPPSAPVAPRPPKLERFFWSSGSQLGVTVDSLSDQLKDYFGTKDGVLVTAVTQESPAARAGVKAGDVIVSVNGSTVDDPADVRQQMQRVDAGAEFTLTIVRDKKPMTLKGKTEEVRSRRSTVPTIL